jgi:diketogulonate reductase-like aldo/keto reductase
MYDVQKGGRLKSIGISTFGVRHIQDLLETELPLPVVNQARTFHPRTSQMLT